MSEYGSENFSFLQVYIKRSLHNVLFIFSLSMGAVSENLIAISHTTLSFIYKIMYIT